MRGKPLLAKLARPSNYLDIPLLYFLNTDDFGVIIAVWSPMAWSLRVSRKNKTMAQSLCLKISTVTYGIYCN